MRTPVLLALALATALAAPGRARADRDDDDRNFRRPSHVVIVHGYGPQSGPPGTLVTVRGEGFVKATKILFDGRKVPLDSKSWNEIRFRVPPDARSGTLELKHPGGWNDLVLGPFRVSAGAPWISSFSPASGPPGTRVAI
jgi:hypothetical protein